ncbi:hypothetical protein N7450_011554 [Penicillium hetheringtonii]|uniref:MACPF-like domain-containing protein n=1 Tax=Penicillium hetheringtonii TaxID=911720 RepID=A0AAD6DAE3_9EURO|nr:hypothetical protein N7450_011554 [Penicillium hetheringtonii]
MPVEAPKDGTDGSTKVSILRVHRYDPSTQAATQQRIIQVGDYNAIEDKKLDIIRSLLVTEGVFDSPDAGSPFCDKKGSELSDTTDVKVYFNIIGADSPKDEGSSASVGLDLNVYYKKRKMRTELDSETKDFLKKQLDLSLKDQKLSEADVKRLKSTFDISQWKATAGAKQSHAADLSESEWSIITRTNCLLSGHKMVVYHKKMNDGKTTTTTKEMRVERSPYSAFRLKRRDFEEYEILAKPQVAGATYGTPTAAATSKLAFRIPRFRVDDDSQVSVYETQNALESSLAKSGFSETSVEASGGGGFWGVSAAARAGFAIKEENTSITAKSEERKVMNIVYKFPRVSVYLDPGSLEVTDECREDVGKVVNQKTLIEFSNKYGDIFSQRVQLGGALFASEDSKAVSNQTKETKAKAMKASAAASFSSSFAQASASASHSSGEASGQARTQQDLTNSMAWEAIGGDSLLCNNPPAWCATVGDFYNWRVIEQNSVLPLYKVLSLFDGFEGIQQRFEDSAENKFQADRRVRFEFGLVHKSTKYPLAVSKVNSLLEHLEAEFKNLPQGVPSFDKYRKDTLEKITKSAGTIRCDDTNDGSGSRVWTMEHDLPRSVSQLPFYSKNVLQNADNSFNGAYAANSGLCSGYYDKEYMYLTQSWDACCYFRLVPVEQNQTKIEEGTKVYIHLPYNNVYLARTASGLVTALKLNVTTGEFWTKTAADMGVTTPETFVFQVRTIKMKEI